MGSSSFEVGHGFAANSQLMDNGELRARLMHETGSGYIWTEPPADQEPSWQNAHLHKGVRETYIVERGRMAFVWEDNGGNRHLEVFEAGEVVSSVPGQQHNVFLFSGSAIHTVKHGEAVGNPEKGGADWYSADVAFDSWTKRLPANYILEMSEAHKFLIGSKVSRRGIIVAVGEPISKEINAPPACPVRFEDGTYGVLFNWLSTDSLIVSADKDWNQALRHSVSMPDVGTLASDTIHIKVVGKDGRIGRMRTFYNEKADRRDELRWKQLDAA